jgi:beta-glucosidase
MFDDRESVTMAKASFGIKGIMALAMGATALAPIMAHSAAPARQIAVESRSKAILSVNGLKFRDLDGDGKLTPMRTGASLPSSAPTI